MMMTRMMANCIHRFRFDCFACITPILHPTQPRHRAVKIGQKFALSYSLSPGGRSRGPVHKLHLPCSRRLHVLGFSCDCHLHLPDRETEAQEDEVIWAGSHRGERGGSLSFLLLFFSFQNYFLIGLSF